jgi:hypothetical protein
VRSARLLARPLPAPELIEQRFNAFTPLQRILLAEIAGGAIELTGQKTLQAVAAKLGASVTAGGVRKALISLPADVLSNPERGSYVIVDPMLASWLTQRAQAL